MKNPNAVIPFEPVPVRPRRDGWTVEKQYAFIEALAETGIVEEACRRVGMSRTSADNLRRRPCGVHFRRAWEAALDYSLYRIEEDAFTRSRRGVARPIFYKGEQVGEWRHYDERLTMFLLRSRRPQRYGKWIDRMLAPEPRRRTHGQQTQASSSTAASRASSSTPTMSRPMTRMTMARNSPNSRARVEGTTLATSG